MNVGDLVKTPKPCFPKLSHKWYWWHDKVGIILKKALPTIEMGEPISHWHVLIGTDTANLEERTLELINENR